MCFMVSKKNYIHLKNIKKRNIKTSKPMILFFFFFFLSANKNTRDKREKRIYILQVTEAQVINPCW